MLKQRLRDLGIQLKEPAPPVANFVHSVRTGNLVFLAGHGPQKEDGTWMQGKIGRDMSLEEGNKAARLTGINMLSSLKAEIGDLNKVKRVVKVHGMVNSDESFTDQPKGHERIFRPDGGGFRRTRQTRPCSSRHGAAYPLAYRLKSR